MESIVQVSQSVFSTFGNGYEKSLYVAALKIGLQLEEQMLEESRSWPITYEGFSTGHSVTADLVVNQEVAVLVCVDDEESLDADELRRVLLFSGLKDGILVNFGEDRLRVVQMNVNGNVRTKFVTP